VNTGVTQSDARFFPVWFVKPPAESNTTKKPAGIQNNMSESTQWGDFDGSEHPYGPLPDGWEGNIVRPQVPSGRAKKHLPKPVQEDVVYARFMASIVKGLDEDLKRHIYERAERYKDVAPTSGTDSDSTDHTGTMRGQRGYTPIKSKAQKPAINKDTKQRGISNDRHTQERNGATQVPAESDSRPQVQVSMRDKQDEPTHQGAGDIPPVKDQTHIFATLEARKRARRSRLPDIFTLRGITPGGEPKRQEWPKGTHNPLEQIPPNSYLAKTVAPTGEPDPGGPDSLSTNTDSSSYPSSQSGERYLRKSEKRRRHRRNEKLQMDQAAKIKIDPPVPYDGSSDFKTFE
jgi:hypothetical protein